MYLEIYCIKVKFTKKPHILWEFQNNQLSVNCDWLKKNLVNISVHFIQKPSNWNSKPFNQEENGLYIFFYYQYLEPVIWLDIYL